MILVGVNSDIESHAQVTHKVSAQAWKARPE